MKGKREKGLMALPEELVLLILGRLPIGDLLACSLVCKHFRTLTLDPSLWQATTHKYLFDQQHNYVNYNYR